MKMPYGNDKNTDSPQEITNPKVPVKKFAGAPIMPSMSMAQPVLPARINLTPLMHAAVIESLQRGALIVQSVEIRDHQGVNPLKAEMYASGHGRLPRGCPDVQGTLTIEKFEVTSYEGELVLALLGEHAGTNREPLASGDYALVLDSGNRVCQVLQFIGRNDDGMAVYHVEFPSGARGDLNQKELLGLPSNVGIIVSMRYLFRCVKNDVNTLNEAKDRVVEWLERLEEMFAGIVKSNDQMESIRRLGEEIAKAKTDLLGVQQAGTYSGHPGTESGRFDSTKPNLREKRREGLDVDSPQADVPVREH
jgi:hypothetical protein